MTPTKFLIGQIIVGFAVAIGGLWFATNGPLGIWAISARLGRPGSIFSRCPVYRPWACSSGGMPMTLMRRRLFNEAGAIAASSGFAGCAVAIIGSLWRARQNQLVTTYGSSRWATAPRNRTGRAVRAAGVFLGRIGGRISAPRRAGTCHGVRADTVRQGRRPGGADAACRGRRVPSSTTSRARTGSSRQAGAPRSPIACCSIRPIRAAPVTTRLLEVRKGPGRSSRRPEHRRHSGRSGRRAGTAQPLGKDQSFAARRRHPPCPVCRRGKDTGAGRELPVRSAALLRAHAAGR